MESDLMRGSQNSLVLLKRSAWTGVFPSVMAVPPTHPARRIVAARESGCPSVGPDQIASSAAWRLEKDTRLLGAFTYHAARTFTVVGGSSGVPSNATAVTGNLTVTGQTSSGYLFIGPVATNNPTSSTLNFPVGDDRANAVTVQLGGGGTLSITFVAPSNGPSVHAIFDVTGYFTPDTTGATYHAITPTRALDTRNGTGGLSGPFTNHAARTFTVGGVPAGATAVTGNLTVTGQTSSGYLFIGPVVTNNPGSSTLNFPVGDDRANAVTVALGAGGTISITFVAPSNGPSANAIFDVTGYFTSDMSGATYVPLTPTRTLDTRNGTGGLSGPFTNHAARTFTVSGVPSNATAVTGNLTVTGQTSSGYLFIGPIPTNSPTSSTLNFPVGDDRANAVTVALSGSGSLSVTFVAPTAGQTTFVIFDVTGYFTPDSSGATYHAITPNRILDSRDGTGGILGPIAEHSARTFPVAGVGGVPSNATAVTGNLTVTGQTSNGYLFLGPIGANNPTSSTLNFPVADDRANAVTVARGGDGRHALNYVAPTAGQTTFVIFDVTGYFTPDSSGATYHALAPNRILDSRDGTGGILGPIAEHSARTFPVAGVGGVPSNATAVTGNLTVTGQTSNGYLFLGPIGANNPTSSTLNFPVADD